MRREFDRAKAFSRRALLLAGGQAAFLGLLAGRLYYLQVVEADQYKLLAEENRINMRLLPPPRGRILDRFGVELANSQRNYRVVLVPEDTASVEETLAALGRLINIDERDRHRVLRETGRNRPFVPVTVVENLSWIEFAEVNVHSPDLSGIQPEVGESRHYPRGAAFAHVVGYVAAVAEADLTGDPLLEMPGFRIGKSGIEKTYDMALRGAAGDSRVEVNAYGRVISELKRNDGQPGADAVLTLDADLHEFAARRLGEESGAAVVLDVHGGEVLALASAPDFDPNAFNIGMGREQWRALVSNPKAPLTNKAIAGQYPPGSAFKMMVALAALESGAITPDHRVFCTGSVKLGNREFFCWKRRGHGDMGFLDGFQQSCDSYFYDIALRTGVDHIAEMARRFGLGSRFGLDLPGENPGLIPDRDWKLALRGEPWQKGETLNTGIGQGFVLTTPLQLAVMTAGIANGGFRVVPRLVRVVGEQAVDAASADESLGLDARWLGLVREGMRRVTNTARGTAYRSRIEEPEFAMAGKTGTSQVRRITRRERTGPRVKDEDKPWIERDHAIFVAYAPVEGARYAVAVVIEHGGSGSRTAAPIARDILLEAQRRDPLARPAFGAVAAGARPLGTGSAS